MYPGSHVERQGSNWAGRIDDNQNIDSNIRAQGGCAPNGKQYRSMKKFEQLVVALLTAVIAFIVALPTKQLLLHAL